MINKEISENTDKSNLPSCRGIQDFMYLYRGEATYLDAVRFLSGFPLA